MQLPSPTLGWNTAYRAACLTAGLHLLGTILAMSSTPAGAALLGVFMRAAKRAMACGTPCVVTAQRSAIGSTASQRHV